jgi:hypothetical protein
LAVNNSYSHLVSLISRDTSRSNAGVIQSVLLVSTWTITSRTQSYSRAGGLPYQLPDYLGDDPCQTLTEFAVEINVSLTEV